jgi:hypothetical protein
MQNREATTRRGVLRSRTMLFSHAICELFRGDGCGWSSDLRCAIVEICDINFARENANGIPKCEVQLDFESVEVVQ